MIKAFESGFLKKLIKWFELVRLVRDLLIKNLLKGRWGLFIDDLIYLNYEILVI